MRYWKKEGPENTQATVDLVVEKARDLNLQHIVVASNTGKTAEKFIGSGLQIVCVTHHVGFKSPGEDEMPKEMRKKLKDNGIEVLTTTHLMAGVDRSLRFKHQGVYPAEIAADTLRIFSQGIKVCIEIAGMALDAGLIPYGEDVISVGGSHVGADSAVVLRPAHSNYFFDTKVREILCKPRDW